MCMIYSMSVHKFFCVIYIRLTFICCDSYMVRLIRKNKQQQRRHSNHKGEDSDKNETDEDEESDGEDESDVDDDDKYEDVCECVSILQKDALLSPIEIIMILSKVIIHRHMRTRFTFSTPTCVYTIFNFIHHCCTCSCINV